MRKFDLNNPIDCAYLAGLFDGEGSVHIRLDTRGKKGYIGRSFMTEIVITNNCEELITSLKTSIGGNYYGRLRASYSKECYEWKLTNFNAVNFIKAILPYALLKKPDLEVCLKMCERFSQSYGRSGLPNNEFNVRLAIYKEFKAFRERQENDKVVVTYGSVIVPSQADVKQPLNESLLLAPQKK
jgi:hypothetical protein